MAGAEPTTAALAATPGRSVPWTSVLSGTAARTLLFLCRLAVGGIFIYSAYEKIHFDGAWHLRDYYFFFAMNIDSYKMLSLWAVEWMARVLPWMEAVLGVLLILGVALRWVAPALGVLLVIFMTALTKATFMNMDINCGCFGTHTVKPGTELLHDAGLLVLTLAVAAGAFLTPQGRGRPS